jgi:hypothetical protein
MSLLLFSAEVPKSLRVWRDFLGGNPATIAQKHKNASDLYSRWRF